MSMFYWNVQMWEHYKKTKGVLPNHASNIFLFFQKNNVESFPIIKKRFSISWWHVCKNCPNYPKLVRKLS